MSDDELREQVAHLAAVSVENCQYLERAWADKSRLIADNARLQDEINRLSNMVQDYGDKLLEWQERTGCSCPTEASNTQGETE